MHTLSIQIIFVLVFFPLWHLYSQTWTNLNSNYPFNDSTIKYLDCSFLNNRFGVAISTSQTGKAELFSSTNVGIKWIKMKEFEPADRNFQAHLYDSTHFWVIRSDCMVYYTTNGGVSWDSSKFNNSIGYDWGNRIHFFNPLEGIVFGRSRWNTSDGGKTWNKIVLDSTQEPPKDIHFANRNKGWIVGDKNPRFIYGGFISATIDGGINWKFQDLYTTSPYTPIMYSVDFIDSLNGFALGNNGTFSSPYLYSTTDGGEHWNRPQLYGKGLGIDIGVFNAKYLWFTSWYGRIFNSNDSGKTWTVQILGENYDLPKIKIFKETKDAFLLADSRLVGPYTLFYAKLDNITEVKSSTTIKNIPTQIELDNFPNPFNNSTQIVIKLNDSQISKLVISDCLGREVKSIILNESTNEVNTVSWNGTNNSNEQVPSGMYFCKVFDSNKFSSTLKIIYIK